MEPRLWRAFTAALGVALLASACSSNSPALTVEDYATAIGTVESRFVAQGVDARQQPGDRDPYPLGGDLMMAGELYMQFQERLNGWRAITPPPEITDLHERLVDALTAVQREVGGYIGEKAISEGDLDFASIGPAVRPFLVDASEACVALQAALIAAGAPVTFADGCEF